jgi:hypothetical protein
VCVNLSGGGGRRSRRRGGRSTRVSVFLTAWRCPVGYADDGPSCCVMERDSETSSVRSSRKGDTPRLVHQNPSHNMRVGLAVVRRFLRRFGGGTRTLQLDRVPAGVSEAKTRNCSEGHWPFRLGSLSAHPPARLDRSVSAGRAASKALPESACRESGVPVGSGTVRGSRSCWGTSGSQAWSRTPICSMMRCARRAVGKLFTDHVTGTRCVDLLGTPSTWACECLTVS